MAGDETEVEEVEPVKVELLIENEGRLLFDYDKKWAERQRKKQERE